MDLGLSGKTALVTASSKGLGRATAVALASEGVKVMVNGRDSDRLRQVVEQIQLAGGTAGYMGADVTDPSAPARLVQSTVDEFGSIDILVANAAGPRGVRAMDVTDGELSDALEANFHTSVRLIQAAVPHMKENQWGRICAITSRAVKQPIVTNSLSNVARTALWAWAKTAAQDLFADGITLNLACPGLHETERLIELYGGVPNEPVGSPDDFGQVVTFLCSQQAKFVTGSAVQVDGGATTGLL